MSARLLDGKTIAGEIRAETAERVRRLKQERGLVPGLAVILVGEDPASQIYVRNKERACAEAGILSRTLRLPGDTAQAQLLKLIGDLNEDPAVHGILVQLPLPGHLNEAEALAAIRPEKDVDGFHIRNAGALFTGAPGVVACTPKGAMALLKRTGVPLSGKEAVVVGRSNIVGKPMAMLLLNANCTVTVCHSRTADLAACTRRADILVAAVGKPRFITGDMVKEGAMVIDVGINRVDGRVVGDVDFDSVKEKTSWLTPVPGGVGPMTIAMLLENTLEAAERA